MLLAMTFLTKHNLLPLLLNQKCQTYDLMKLCYCLELSGFTKNCFNPQEPEGRHYDGQFVI